VPWLHCQKIGGLEYSLLGTVVIHLYAGGFTPSVDRPKPALFGLRISFPKEKTRSTAKLKTRHLCFKIIESIPRYF